MSKMKFPHLHADGTFNIDIRMSTAAGVDFCNLEQRARDWLRDDWMPANNIWTRIWKSGSHLSMSREQVLRFQDEFSGPPEIVSCKGPELILRLHGKATKFWRDWMVKLLREMKEAFPEIEGVQSIKNTEV